jgi:SAM-dependent methyltransferase
MSLRRLLGPLMDNPAVYAASQRAIGAKRSHDIFMNEYVRAGPTEAVLDIGCGVGASLAHLGDGNRYVGVDIDAQYIDYARKQFNNDRHFICADAAQLTLAEFAPFSCAFAYGVIHHLDNASAQRMFETVAGAVTGRFITIDPVIRPNDNPIARYLISQDRGRFVRTEPEYVSIASKFGPVTAIVLTNLLYVPYSHLVMSLDLRRQPT